MRTETVKIKADNQRGYKLIDKSNYNPDQHEAIDDVASSGDREVDDIAKKMEAERKARANIGQVAGGFVSSDAPSRNPTGTFSEPTPTDIRYPNKAATEFENNLGIHAIGNAASLREARGLPQEPGGLIPEAHKQVEDSKTVATDVPRGTDPRGDTAKIADALDGSLELAAGKTSAGSTDKSGDDLEGMTLAELRAHAEAENIDLGDATRKADVLSRIREAK